MELFDRIADPNLLSRRLNITANNLTREEDPSEEEMQQMDFFADKEAQVQEAETMEREKRRQQAMLGIKRRFGKNAILRGMNLKEGATAIERNSQIGGHKA